VEVLRPDSDAASVLAGATESRTEFPCASTRKAVSRLRTGTSYQNEEKTRRWVLLFHDGVSPDRWWKGAMNRESSPKSQVLEVMTFGKNCKRCGVYFVTRNRIEDLCPWCTRVQTGEDLEGLTERVDDPAFAGL